MLKFLTGILLLSCVWMNAASIYGYTATASGPLGYGDVSYVLGAHNDSFIQISNNTAVTIRFATGMAALADGTSAVDLRIHTYDQPAPVNGTIEISKDGINFTSLGIFSDANVNNVIDFNLDSLGFTHVVAVRVTDISGTSDGFDLDAIEGFYGGTIPVPEPTSLLLALAGILFWLIRTRSDQ